MSSIFNAKKLESRSESKNRYSDTEKYYITCQDRITDRSPTTNDWLTIERKLKDTNNKDLNRILVGLLDKHKDVIIKISSYDTLIKEHKIGELVKDIPGFMKFYCFFQCKGNYKDYPKTSTKALCEGIGTSMNVLVMPYWTMGSLKQHIWNTDNYACLRSCLLQLIASLFQAYETNALIHNDMHLDNVLLKKTRRTDIEYTLNGKKINILSQGCLIAIMDFEQSSQDREHHGISLLYKDIRHSIEDLHYSTNISIDNRKELDNYLTDSEKKSYKDWDSYKEFNILAPIIEKLVFKVKPVLSLTYNPLVF